MAKQVWEDEEWTFDRDLDAVRSGEIGSIVCDVNMPERYGPILSAGPDLYRALVALMAHHGYDTSFPYFLAEEALKKARGDR